MDGAYIGCMLDRQDVLERKYLLLPALVLVAVFAVNGLISGAVICKEGLCELGADFMVLHILRVILAVSVLPQLAPVLAGWL